MNVRAQADYRAVITAWVAEHPEVGFRGLAEGAGLAPAALAAVLRRHRHLDAAAAERLARTMRLGDDAARLVELVRAESAIPSTERRSPWQSRATASNGSSRS